VTDASTTTLSFKLVTNQDAQICGLTNCLTYKITVTGGPNAATLISVPSASTPSIAIAPSML